MGGEMLKEKITDDTALKKTNATSGSEQKTEKSGIISDFLFAFVLTFFYC